MAATTDRYLTQQAELLDSTVDRGALAALAAPLTTGTGRVPGIKLHDDRLIRLLDNLLYTGGLLGAGRRGNCTNASWLGTASPRTTTPSDSFVTT